MRRVLLSLCLSGIMFSGIGYTQNISNIPEYSLPTPDLNAIALEDEERAKNGVMYRIGINIPVELDIYKEGEWFNDNNGTLVYNVLISSNEAKALNITFDALQLPENAEMRLYNPTTGYVVGPYNKENSENDGEFATAHVYGNQMVLEVAIPENAVGEFKLHVKDIGYFYRNVNPFDGVQERDFADSESCEVNINCSEGSSWQNQKGGVCRILVNDGGYGWCSGSLVNNTANDCTPYVLTAQHCGSGASAANFRTWVYYFKYEASGCTNPGSEPSSSSVTGSVRVASSGTTSTVGKSDFLLVILKNRPAAAASAYYNGWNRSTSVSGGGVGIHHPAGDIQKISTYSSTPVQSTWSGSGISNGHWRVTWIATTNGHGVTEGGSSGSPLFNGSGLIIGDLSGGSSFCASPNSPDLYGKLSYSWSSCGTTPDYKLESWLDRSAAGSTTLTGKANSTCTAASLPVAEFTASNIYPLVSSETVTLTDNTTNSPFYWQWVVTPATHTFVGGTTKYSQNPQLTFSAVGNYTVTLYAANIAGYHFKVKSSYIHVGNLSTEEEIESTITMYPNPVTDMLYINLGNNTWNMENISVSIMDLTGKYVMMQKVDESNANTLSISIPENIATGFYFVQVTDGKNSTTEKLEIVK